ncbi:MAG: adenosylcobinamide-GDP ribazoletransferase, partial [Geminicoccaceae bacterium]
IAILITGFFLPLSQAFIVIAFSSLGACICLLLARQQIGGITGDVLGALQQTAEISALIALVAMMSTP